MTDTRRMRVAVLISGSGSNLKALIDAVASGRLDIDIVQVISNRAEAGGLEHARRAGIAWSVIDRTSAAYAHISKEHRQEIIAELRLA